MTAPTIRASSPPVSDEHRGSSSAGARNISPEREGRGDRAVLAAVAYYRLWGEVINPGDPEWGLHLDELRAWKIDRGTPTLQ